MIHVEGKVVIRYEVWCDQCSWTGEYADSREAHDRGNDHEKHHRQARAARGEK
jgi:hypothetical protein